jgi:GMP synthase (glutamine-hydrolysing)
VKPFLLLGVRADDAAADDEYAAFLRFSGLDESELRRFRLEKEPLGDVKLTDWSGVILGGGPFNVSDPPSWKSPVQQRVEADLHRLVSAVVEADYPFLGACYGIGTLGGHQGALIDRQYAEPVGAVEIELTSEGQADPLFEKVPPVFEAFVGHKEAVSRLPEHATLLAGSVTCPVQAFRVGSNVYATQFHPELDVGGLCTRIDVYKYAGYFAPSEADELKAEAARRNVVHPPAVLRAFVDHAITAANAQAGRVP